MPLLHRRVVKLDIPSKELSKLPEDAPVFYLAATGEIFLDYESYSARMRFLSEPIFQCEYSGKTGLDYFTAVESERTESQIVRERFPDELKGRVLHSVQFQVMGRLDGLVDMVYDRYKDRYFPGEKVFVDLSGDKYFARISRVFPPASVRARADEQKEKERATMKSGGHRASGSSPLSSLSSSPGPIASTSAAATNGVDHDDSYSHVSHVVGTDLNISLEDAIRSDPPEEYFYTIQLMDTEQKFEGSFMEVKSKTMSRDRLNFSKSILKRYLRECVTRDGTIGAPWVVKAPIALQFGVTQQRTELVDEKNREEREKVLSKRRKTTEDASENGEAAPTPKAPPAKRRKAAEKAKQDDATSTTSNGTTEKKPTAARAIKYPIEDLELDPMSIHDLRLLKRQQTDPAASPLELPPKPAPQRPTTLIQAEHFHPFVSTWTFLNIFSKALHLSTFTLDEFAGALKHGELTGQSCRLLVELHAVLTNVIGTDTSRVLGSTGASVLPIVLAEKAARDAGGSDAEGEEDEVGDDEDEDELAEDDDGASSRGSSMAPPPPRGREERELDMLIRTGIRHARRWDRTAKLKSAEGRAGWEKHMIGALCQRGGPRTMPNLARILRHLFQGADLSLPSNGALSSSSKPFVDRSDPRKAYPSLLLEDKLAVLAYLCTLVGGSKAVRTYMEESETQLTGLRKQRAEVNRERRELLDQHAAIEGKRQLDIEEAEKKALSCTSSAAADGDQAHTTTDGVDDNSSKPDVRSPAAPTGSFLDKSSPIKADGAEEDEVDELEDDDGDDELMSDSLGSGANGTSGTAEAVALFKTERQAAMAERKIVDSARAQELAKQREVARAADAERREYERQRGEVDDQLRANGKRDDWVEREFRRWQGVSRCRPLGKDRFFCRYWWFDGIGGSSLVREGPGPGAGGGVQYGAGRLFVQGPSAEDWAFASGLASGKVKAGGKGKAKEAPEPAQKDEQESDGMMQLDERRRREEIDEQAVLGVDEWGFYDNEAEIDALQTWLNPKGTRELGLKNAIAKWRGYILAGARKRLAETSGSSTAPVTFNDGRRGSSRKKDEPDQVGNQYLYWQNKLAKY